MRNTQAIAPILLLLATGAVTISAQPALINRVVYVSVTDPLNRFVTGLDGESFEVVENGTPRPITGFSDPDSPISIAIVSDVPLPPDNMALSGPRVELIRAQSLPEALQRLAASKNPRKGLIIDSAAGIPQIPGDIQVMQLDPSIFQKAVIELRNQYMVRFGSPAPSGSIDVVVKQQTGLPFLRTHWK